MNSQQTLFTQAELQMLNSSQQVFLANLLVLPGSAKDSKTSVFSGKKSTELSKLLAQSMSYSKIAPNSSEHQMDWLWEAFSLTFPRWGMLSNGQLFRRSPLALPTYAKESGLLPTPTKYQRATVGNQEPYITKSGTVRTKNKKGKSSNMGLRAYVQMYPTPTVSDSHGAHHNTAYQKKGDFTRLRDFLYPTGDSGTIYPHPEFVEALMGFPDGWTDLNR